MIIQASAAAIPLPDESVHCVVTSPPYWGLRSYGTPPQVWGGDLGCDHDWGKLERGKRKDLLPVDRSASVGRTAAATSTSRMATGEVQAVAAKTGGRFCSKCDAWLGELGLEPSLNLYVEHTVIVFREIWRVLRSDGTAWLNLGDSYAGGGCGHRDAERWPKQSRNDHFPRHSKKMAGAGLKFKDLCMMPARVALALQADGWWIRKDIIWAKRNTMPESTEDRPTSSHEYIFLMAKSEQYYYDHIAIQEPAGLNTHPRGGGVHPKSAAHGSGNESFEAAVTRVVAMRNKRDVWFVASEPNSDKALDFESADYVDVHGLPRKVSAECPVHAYAIRRVMQRACRCPLSYIAHFATMPTGIVEPCVLAGTSERGCCSQCGSPQIRIAKKTTQFHGGSGAAGRTAEEVNSAGKWAGLQYGKNIKLGNLCTA